MIENMFHLESIRFNIRNKDQAVVAGWYANDEAGDTSILVAVDDTPCHIAEKKVQEGIFIRRKYLGNGQNVGKEIFLYADLPENWGNGHKVTVYTAGPDGKKEVSGSMEISKLASLRQGIDYYVESVSFSDGVLSITGWALAEGTVEVFLEDKDGSRLDAKVDRTFRSDVLGNYPELMEIGSKEEAGFHLTAQVSKGEKLFLVMKAQGRQERVPVSTKKEAAASAGGTAFKRGVRFLKRHGMRQTIQRVKQEVKKHFQGDLSYPEWIAKYDVKEKDLKAQKKEKFAFSPKISIVVPLYRTDKNYLEELVSSVKAQTYGNWELCLADGSIDENGKSPLTGILEQFSKGDARIKTCLLKENGGISENTNGAIRLATGDYIGFADHDDLLAPNALYENVKALNEDPSIDMLYSDEDKVSMDGKKRFEPNFKPDFDLDFLCSVNYICHFLVVKKELMDEVGTLRREYDGAQDHDFILRCSEKAHRIYHIPKILYHWRSHMDSTAANPESKKYAFEAGIKAVEAHYKRLGIPATVEHGAAYGLYRTRFLWKEQPLVSILVPNKDHIDDLKKCMDSIDRKSTYRNYEFIIIENNSTDPATFDYYKEIEKREDVTVAYYDGDFNFSRINNFGETYAKGEYLLLLNNDIEMITPDCLSEMLGYGLRPDVGIVGAKLCYPDNTIQHAGVVIGYGGIAGHTFIGQPRDAYGYQSRICCAQDYSAVTAACLLVRRSIYEEVGGLTEELKVAFNDIDFCLKVREKGYLVVYDPFAELYHYESKSRGLEDTPEKVERFQREMSVFQERWKAVLRKGDPYYNPNLTLDKSDFSLKA